MNNEELINDIIDKLNASVKDIDDQLSALEGADELDDTINNRRFTLEQRKAPLENLIRSMQGVTTNIRALNELDEIVPRDDQDREEMRDERRQREEENDRRLSELPLEYQREIDDFAIAEVAEIEERIEELRNNRQTTLASEYFKRMTTEEHDLARLRERLYNSALRETEALRGLNEQNSTEEEREYQEEIVKKLRESLTDEQRETLDNAMREQNVDQVQQEVSAENANNPEIETFEGLIEHIISELESSRDSVSQQLAELEGADELDDTVNERRFSLELRRQNFDNLIRSMQGVTTNIRALNELDEIVPRDDQDREEMREERRQREEENDRRLNELPLEYQREIDDFVIAEMARTEERIEELRNNRQTTLASEYFKRMTTEEHTLERLRERLYNSTLREIEEFNRLRQTGRNENERAEQEERVIKLRRNLTDEQRRRTDAATNTNSNVNQDQVGLNSDQTVVPNPTEVTGTGQNAEPNPADVVETGQNTEPNPTEVTGTGQNAEPNPTEVTEGEQTRLPELNKDVNILDENFNPFSISFDDFTNRVSTERRRLLAENTAESASNLQKINDMIIYESENFYIKIEYGCLKRGMVMICPKFHVLSVANIPDKYMEEYVQVMRDIEYLLKGIYGEAPVIFFEHGSASNGIATHKSSVVHAHTHVAWGVPFEKKYLDMVCLKPARDIRDFKDRKYMSYQEGTDGQLLVVADSQVYIQRQYPRQVIGDMLGIEPEQTGVMNLLWRIW